MREREATICWKRLDLALIELSHVKISTVDLPKPIIVIDNENTFQAIRWINKNSCLLFGSWGGGENVPGIQCNYFRAQKGLE